MHTIFPDAHFLDFHTHSMRQQDREDVTEIVSIHLGKEKERKYFTVGLHPWWTDQVVTEAQKTALKRMLTDSHCLAMGEMGLDKLKGPPMKLQMDILRSQLQIARELEKAVIIHCVRAFEQLMTVRKEFPEIKRWCVHGYGRHAILGRQLIDQGFHLSLMPGLPAAKYVDLFESLPHDRIFLETDSMPGINIEQVYERVSTTLGMELPALCRQIYSNARAFFGI